MYPTGTRLDASAPILVLPALRTVSAALLDLLRGLTETDWSKPTVHPDRDVKDLTAHLLHGNLRRVSGLRDGYRRPAPPIGSVDELIAFIQQDNRDFMTGLRRISPGILVELIDRYDRETISLLEGLDPIASGLGVAWAGEDVSANWFDVAREYTERWHHQQQLRDATGRPPLYDQALLEPALETFARGLPFAYRSCDAPDGATIAISTMGHVSLDWTLRRVAGRWVLFSGPDAGAPTRVAIPADVAWRLWTKGIDSLDARARLHTVGDAAAVEPLLGFVAIMA